MWCRKVCAVLLTATLTLGLLGAAERGPEWPRANKAGEETAQACGAACVVGAVVFALVLLAVNIAILVWVARDAKARGMDNAILWMLLVFFTGLIGLVVFIFVRPQGKLMQCAHCQNKRLEVSAKCPHCGNA